ncbi:MAG: hypothetical protein KF831_11420 [Acidobacteria bacterium]|nr:hypothetical protein [Acidobacteriota bacterium]
MEFSGTFLAVVAVIVLLVGAAVAYIAFRVLRKSVRLAIRLVLAGALLIGALVGGGTLWYNALGSDAAGKSPPARRR